MKKVITAFGRTYRKDEDGSLILVGDPVFWIPQKINASEIIQSDDYEDHEMMWFRFGDIWAECRGDGTAESDDGEHVFYSICEDTYDDDDDIVDTDELGWYQKW